MNQARKIRCTAIQKRKLVEYMASHPLFANGEFNGPLGSQRHESEWHNLATALREFGPDKPVAAWKVTWRDLKRKARSDNAAFRRAVVATGNNSEIPPVGESELMVLSAIGQDSSIGVGPPESTVGGIQIYDVMPHYQDGPFFPPAPASLASSPPVPTLTSVPHSVPHSFPPSLIHPSTRSRARNRSRPAHSTTRFEELQVENNQNLKNILEEIKISNLLKREHNDILKEHNRIMERNQLQDTQIIADDDL